MRVGILASDGRRPAERREPTASRAAGPDKRRMDRSGTLWTSRLARSRPQAGEGTSPAEEIN